LEIIREKTAVVTREIGETARMRLEPKLAHQLGIGFDAPVGTNDERPRRIALLPRLLAEEEGELTPSLKVKLRVVKERYADRIAYLFDEADAKE
jgi:long-subunit acyl-CoA synthetase (AMP-forming)